MEFNRNNPDKRESTNEQDIDVVYAYESGFCVGKLIHRREYRGEKWIVEGFREKDSISTSFDCIARTDSLIDAKLKFLEWWEANKEELPIGKAKKIKANQLPMEPNPNFFPTPSSMAGQMLARVNWKAEIRTILEPSAGKGDLVDSLVSFTKEDWKGKTGLRNSAMDSVDCIESDLNLQAILVRKGYRLVADDFLSFHTAKNYDLILMNPPFDEGDAHLLKALLMQEESGGQIVCLLNAETIRNPYTNRRELLIQKLKEHNASITFVKDAFKHAERKSKVEVAIVAISIPKPVKSSSFFEGCKKAVQERWAGTVEPEALAPGNWLEQMVQNYEAEAEAGKRIFAEYTAIKPYLMNTRDYGRYNCPVISLCVNGHEETEIDSNVVNKFLRCVRSKYWRALFDRDEIRAKLTSKMSKEYSSKIGDMCDYDFSLFNIKKVLVEIDGQLQQGVVDSIQNLFHQLSDKYSWYPETESNIHYYNGWRTNEAHKVGMKAIIPANGAYSSWPKGELSSYYIYELIADLEKALDFIDVGKRIRQKIWATGINAAINLAKYTGDKKIQFTFFEATFYKKGTCHIKFRPEVKPLIDRLNIMVGRDKGWLPPNYGKTSYEKMSAEEQAVVDSFQGAKDYAEICANVDYYLADRGSSNHMGLLP